MGQPVVNPRVRLAAMILGVVGGDKPRLPLVRFFLAFGLMKVIEGLAGFLDGSNGRSTLPSARAVVRRPSEPAGMCGITATPRLSITRLKTADFATGPLSRWSVDGMPWKGSLSFALGAMALNKNLRAASTSSP